MIGGLDLRADGDGVVLAVRVLPRAAKDAVSGLRGGALAVRLTAPPVEGAANAALARYLGRLLGVAPSRVALVSGASSRDKRVRIEGVGADAVRERLLELLP